MKAPARHWSSLGEATFASGIWLLYGLHRIAGRLPFLLCLYPVVIVYWLAHPAARRASREYLERVQAATGALGGAPGAWQSVRHFLSFADTILDKMLALSGRYRLEDLHFVGREPIDALLREGRGALFVTAHVGCLELCQASADASPGLELTVLVHTVHAQRFNRLLARLAPARRVRLLQVSEISPATAVLLAERVARGEFVAIAGDRVPLAAGRSTAVEVPFLGHLAPFPTGAYLLASLLKCPLYMLGCVRTGRTHEVRFECLAERVVLPRGDRLAACAGYATAFAARLQALLARAPFEWFNFFSFWDQPRALPPLPTRHD